MTNQLLTNTQREFFPALHGLRGLAVFYVVVSHLGNNELFLFPVMHNYIGKVGVWIFFVLSAFLLTTHLYRDIESSSSKLFAILHYLANRVFRIYPLLVFMLIFHTIQGSISPTEIFRHLLLVQTYGEIWAISVEFQYYLLMPIIVISTVYISQKNAILLFMAVLIVTFVYGIAHAGEIFPAGLNIIPKLIPFLLGSTLSLLFYKNKGLFLESRFKFAFLVPIMSLLMLFIATVLFRSQRLGALPGFYAPWISLGISLAVAGLIYSGLRLPTFRKFIGTKPLIFLGEISFSVYLLHTSIIDMVKNLPYLSTTFQAWVSLGLSIIFAYISYCLIEKPGISIGKKITQNLSKLYLIHQIHAVNNDERA